MKVILEKNEQGIVSIFDEKKRLLREFEFNDNLQKNLQLLRKINSLKTIEGVPIFKTKMIGGISVWSFFQTNLFWHLLWNSTKYEELKKFLFENKITKVVVKQKGLRLENYLKLSGIKVYSGFDWRRTAKKFLSFFTKLLAQIITFLAILKIIIFKIEILTYTPDKFIKPYGCDFRFFKIYKFLRTKKVKFVEVFHTLLGGEFFKNIIFRKSLAVYLESFPILFVGRHKIYKYDLSSFENYERQYLSNILKYLDKESGKSLKRIKTLSRLLKFTKIKSLLSIDDTRSANELIVACRMNNIKTHGFQHGQFSKYHVAWINYDIPKEYCASFDKLYVWNDYSQRLLLDYSSGYDKDNTVPIGGIKEPSPISYKKRELKLPLRILVPYESFAPKKEVGIFLKKLLDFGCELFFKARPDVSVDSQFKEYRLQNFSGIKIVKNIDADVLSQIDAVAGTYTGFLMEMIFYEKPIFIFDTSFDFGHRYIEDDLAMVIKKETTIKEIFDYINDYRSKKNIAWPQAKITLEEILEKIIKKSP